MSQFLNEDQVKANMSFWQMLKLVWPFSRRYPWALAASLFSILGVAISSRMLPTIVGLAIDKGIRMGDQNYLTWAAFVFLAVEITHSVFLFLYQYLFQWFGNRVLFDLRNRLIQHTQNLPMTYFDKTPLGRIVTRLSNDTSSLGEIFTDGVINILTESVVLLSIVISMMMISPRLTFACLAVSPIFVFLAFRITMVIRGILRESKKRLSAMNSYIAENINGIKVVQLFNRVTRNRKKFAGLSRDYRNTLIKSVRQYALLQPIMNLFNAVVISVALYYGGILGSERSIQLGALVAFLMHIQDIVPPLREILEKYQQFQNSLTSAERVFHLLEEPEERYAGSSSVAGQKLKGHIAIRNMTFRYGESLAPALKNVSLDIPTEQSAALIGRTGSGKTTLISLLQRFYECPPNTIFLDSLPIEGLDQRSLRRSIGVVQQDNFIFRGTLKENVSLQNKEISDQMIEQAFQRIGYMDILRRSGRDLNSKVEERGANLSVGERQLIAFARILVFQPDILILDEATANIDSESERLIQKATLEVTKGRTSLIIAHRLSTIRHCNQIFVLDGGEIKESGGHDQLMSQRGLYYEQLKDLA